MQEPRDQIALAHALVDLQEQLGKAEQDLELLLVQAVQATSALLGSPVGLWLTTSGRTDLRAFAHGELNVLPLVHSLARLDCAEPQGVLYPVLERADVVQLGPEGAERLLDQMPDDQRLTIETVGFGGLVAVPLLLADQVTGALVVTSTEESPAIDLPYLQRVARVLARGINHAQVLEDARRQHRRATMLSREDQLTGLLNRRGFLDSLATMLETSPPSALVAIVDLDGFKLVNDGFGHAAGDMLLTSLAARLCAAVPPLTPVARLGGDEFALLVTADDDEEAAGIVEHAVHACTGTLQVVGLSVPITVSVGTAFAVQGGAEEALQHADLAVSRAKRRGGVVAAYDPGLDDPATRRLKEVLELRRAVLGDGLVVHYQPVVNVGPGPLRVEALVRRDMGDRLLLPGAWLDTAERAGLMPELTANVLYQVVGQLERWWAMGLEVECAVNVPAPVLAQADLVSGLLLALDAAGLPRRALSVEVTEGDLVGPQARAALTRCFDADISVAVDDFGTGFSALSYLVDLPLRTLKIDKSFIDGIDVDARRAGVVKAIIEIAHRLGLHVVAEGIESQSVAEVVIAVGADAMQGFLYARPASAEDIEPLLREGLIAVV